MTMLRLGYSHPCLRLNADAIALVRRHGVQHLEVRVDSVDRDGTSHDGEARRTLRDLCRGEGYTLSVHAYSGINLAEKVGRLRDVCIDLHLEQMEFCEAVGASFLTLHLGTCGFGQDPARKAARLAIAHESLARLLDGTAGSPVGLGLENVERLPAGVSKAYLGDRLSELRTTLDLFGARVHAVLDVGHAHLNPELQPVDLLAGLRDQIVGVHIHANDGVKDRHWPLTRNWVDDRAELFTALTALSAEGVPLIAEHHALHDADATLTLMASLFERA